MRQKKVKSMRRSYKKFLKAEAERIGAKLGKAIRKRPWWIPAWLWRKLVYFVLDLDSVK